VITGFRVSMGGAQERLGIEPDLSILGKVLGGGLPVGAVTGPTSVMERLAPVGDTYQAGTLSGNPLATAAGLATLGQLDPQAYDRLERLTDQLASGLREAAASAGTPAHVVSACGLLTVFFRDGPVESWDDARTADAEAFRRFFHAMLERGVYLPPSQFEAWFPSLAHGEREIDLTLEAAAAAFAAVS